MYAATSTSMAPNKELQDSCRSGCISLLFRSLDQIKIGGSQLYKYYQISQCKVEAWAESQNVGSARGLATLLEDPKSVVILLLPALAVVKPKPFHVMAIFAEKESNATLDL